MGVPENWATGVTADVSEPSDQYAERGFIADEGVPAGYMNWILNHASSNIPKTAYNPGWCVSGDIASDNVTTAYSISGYDVTMGSGVVHVKGTEWSPASSVITVGTSHATLHRIDLIVSRDGVFTLLDGLASGTPTYTSAQQDAVDGVSDDLVIVELYIPGGFGSIAGDKDFRYLRPWREDADAAITYYAVAYSTNVPAATPSPSGNSESNITIQLIDRGGNDLALVAPMKIEMFLEDTGGAVVSPEVLSIAAGDLTGGTGSGILFFETDANGAAVINCDAGSTISPSEGRIVQITPLQYSLTPTLSQGGAVVPGDFRYVAAGGSYTTLTFS